MAWEDWRLYAGPLLGEHITAEVPFISADAARAVNGAGDATFVVPPDAAALRDLQPGRTVLYLEHAGWIAWSGLLWVREGNLGAPVSLRCQELESYLEMLLHIADRDYIATDARAIAAALVEQSRSRGPRGSSDHRIATALSGSAAPVDRSYRASNPSDYWARLTDLVGIDAGLDVRVDTAWAQPGSTVTRTMRIGSPRLGRTVAQTGLEVVIGTPAQVTEDAGRATTWWTVRGTGGIYSAPAAGQSGSLGAMPALERIKAMDHIGLTAELDKLARGRANQTGWPILTASTLPMRVEDLPPAAVLPGDDIRLVLDPGCDGRFPAGFTLTQRITGVQVSLSRGDADQIELQMGAAVDPVWSVLEEEA